MAELLEKGRIIAARYKIDRQLGEGGMGAVYLVQHVHTDEQLALKILHSTVIKDEVALERFRREGRTPARINSDHVVRVTDADVAEDLGGAPFLVMEYLRGENLEALVEKRGAMPSAEVVLYLRQTARALDKAHAIGIVHRDLKPENLFLTAREDGTPCIKLLDFGIAKLTAAASMELARPTATTTGTIFGTPLYMSPEQAKGESSRVSPATDVWALGLIAYRLLTGKDFWTATTITHLIAQIAYEDMPAPSARDPRFTSRFDAWFAACCAREVEDRFPSAGEAIGKLARALGVTELPFPSQSITALGSDRSSVVRSRGDMDLSFAEVAAKTLQDPPSSGPPESGSSNSPLKLTASPLTRDPELVAPKKRRAGPGMLAAAAAAVVAVAAGAWWIQARPASVAGGGPEAQAATDGDPSLQGSSGAATTPAVAAAGPSSAADTDSGVPEGGAEPVPGEDLVFEPSVPIGASSSAPTATPASRPRRPPRGAPAVPAPSVAPAAPKPFADPLSGRH